VTGPVRPLLGVCAAAAALLLAACGSAPAPAPPPAPAAPAPSAAAPPAPPVALPQCGPVRVPAFDPANFRSPTKVTNRWMPLVPGTQFTMEGRSNIGGKVLPHQIVFTVTDLVKQIDGIPAMVTWDVDRDKGQLAETELAFFAQDNDGNIWTMGEYPEVYQNGTFTGAPSTWIAGVSRAQAGVQIRSEPKVGGGEYLQGISPDVDFLDCAKDIKTGERTCVPTGCYDGVMVVDERSPLEADSGVQRKFYAAGVGGVRVEAVGDPEGETLVLIKISPPSAATLATARAEALKLDERGYVNSKAVYGRTPKAAPAPAVR
jgi:hypothetical protein